MLYKIQQSLETLSPQSPGFPINGEDAFEHRFAELIERRIRRSLRVAFQGIHVPAFGRTPLAYGHGRLASDVPHGKPDTAYFDSAMHSTARPNRAPGNLKLSWKWPMADSVPSATPPRKREFKQVLSQVNFYRKVHHTRYGYILTDKGFVAIKRLDALGPREPSSF